MPGIPSNELFTKTAIEQIAKAINQCLQGSGPSVTLVLQHAQEIQNTINPLMSPQSKPNHTHATPALADSTQSAVAWAKSNADSLASAAKSTPTKQSIHQGLALAAKHPVMATMAANAVIPGSGLVLLPLLKAYQLPVIKQVMNLVLDRLIDKQVNEAQKKANTVLDKSESPTPFNPTPLNTTMRRP